MSTISDMVQANEQYATGFDGPSEGAPARRLAIVTCMDARLEPLAAFGLQLGDTHVIRNAGGIPTDDVLRSLAISQRALGTRTVVLVHHTRCGMQGFDDEQFRADLTEETGETPSWHVAGFTDADADTRAAIRTVQDCAWLPHRDDVRGFVYDVDSGAVAEVSAPLSAEG